jgi:type VI secretion system protein ImpK
MNIDLTKVGEGKREGLDTLCTDLFLIVIRMREAEDLGEPAALRKLINFYLNLFEKNCNALRIAREEIEYAKYAIIALLDETVLSVPGACRDFWISSPMQLEHFGDNLAGQEFYHRLDKLLTRPQRTRDVLEIYYLCLCLGFEGKFKISNHEERERIIDNVGRQLQKLRPKGSASLSPHAYRASIAGPRRTGGFYIPLWLFGAAAVALLAGGWAILSNMVNQTLAEALRVVG